MRSAGCVINDIFVGLFTKGVDGSSIKGSVKNYTKSEDGLIYTFTLRQDHFWSDGINVTAEDYVNGFRSCLLYTSPSPRDKRQSRLPWWG